MKYEDSGSRWSCSIEFADTMVISWVYLDVEGLETLGPTYCLPISVYKRGGLVLQLQDERNKEF
jgi:hypothetical protein